MSRFDLGSGVSCDLDSLVDTRLLVQANSGGGKSWALRRILEQTHGKIQQLVIDPEGEFSTLREIGDYVLAARHGGETVADPRTAKLLAERLLELGVSAVLDIYELKADQRVAFVRGFLEALVDAPKKLWHPVLVVVDEVHVYCPEKGEAQSASAVIDLATRGRKRGFCAVFATQRLSKLHKDAAAECNNKLIGRTALDIDMKRAADELGVVGRDEMHKLRTLPEGNFFAFGPAISPTVTQVHIGPVRSTHPKAGARLAFAPPPPTAKVKALLPQLSDLPAEAEEKARTEAELRAELAKTRRELTLAQKGVPTAPTKIETRTELKIVEKAVFKDGQLARIEKMVERATTIHQTAVAEHDRFLAGLLPLTAAVKELHALALAVANVQPVPPPAAMTRALAPRLAPVSRTPVTTARHTDTGSGTAADRSDIHLRDGARRMLDALARRYPLASTRSQIGQLAGLARNGGTFSTYLSDLRRAGAISERGNEIEITAVGWELIGKSPGELSPQSTEDVLQLFDGILRDGARRMLDALMAMYPGSMSRAQLGEETNIVHTGGTFSTYLSDLRRAGLIVETRDGLAASETLMDPAGATS